MVKEENGQCSQSYKKNYTARRFDRAGTNMDQQHLSENTII
jgi:hypothetical protein